MSGTELGLPLALVGDIAMYRAAQTEDHKALIAGAASTTRWGASILEAEILGPDYVSEHDMLEVMQAAAPVVGGLAVAQRVPPDVEFVAIGRRGRAKGLDKGWLLWGYRGDYSRADDWAETRLYEWQGIAAHGVALVASGAVQEFLTRPVPDETPIQVVRTILGKPTAQSMALSYDIEARSGRPRMPWIYHRFVVFASGVVQLPES